MKMSLLISNRFKNIGWVVMLLGVSAFVAINFFHMKEPAFLNVRTISLFNADSETGIVTIIQNNIFDELMTIFMIVGGLLVAFSKEKKEDELIEKVRSFSLQCSLLFNYLVLMVTATLFHDVSFLRVMIYNLLTPLLFFIIWFNYIFYTKVKPNLK